MKITSSPDSVNRPLLPLPSGCQEGIFLRRHKRFSVEIELNGEIVWAHCNDTGAMTGILSPGAPALLSPARNPARKLPWTMERIWVGKKEATNGFWVGANSSHPGKILKAAFQAGLLPFASGYENIRMEARHGRSRLDALLTGANMPPLWVECKNVTMVSEGRACFPDSPSERARKHLRELLDIVHAGERAAMFYLAQRPDGASFRPADFIDPAYAALFYEAMEKGVEIYAFAALLGPDGTDLGKMLKIAPA